MYRILLTLSIVGSILANTQIAHAAEPWIRFSHASEDNQAVQILETTDKEIYIEERLDLFFEVEEEVAENKILVSILPINLSLITTAIELDDQKMLHISFAPEEKGQLHQILFTSPGIESQHSFSFIPLSINEFPSVSVVLTKTLQRYLIETLLLLTVLALAGWQIRKYSNKIRLICILILSIGSAIVFYRVVNTMLIEEGLIQINPVRTLYQSLPSESGRSLTIIDENLNLKPGLARSWSNISPLVWEFQLNETEGLESQEIISAVKTYHSAKKDTAITDSIAEILQGNPYQIQMITKYPDPLLAHKMSKIQVPSQKSESTIREPNRFMDDDQEIRAIGMFSLEEEIATTDIDVIIEPPVGIWPKLFQYQYQIQPAINTESVFLLANKANESLTSERLLQLSNILQTGSTLQTSYFQYGQLADQFAPPGITGYTPNLSEEFPETSIKLPPSDAALEIWYPLSEQRLMDTIAVQLRNMGYILNIEVYDATTIEEELNTEIPDLLLVSLQFDIGDIAPFLDTFIDSEGALNMNYTNPDVDELIDKARRELNRYERLQILQEITAIITHTDPAGIPLLFKRSFKAEKSADE